MSRSARGAGSAAAKPACSNGPIVPGSSGDGGPRDAGTDATCELGCHWDCFGGSECVDGEAWMHAFAARECCTYQDPWPDPGPVCGVSSYTCKSGACRPPDPRYQVCVDALDRSVQCDRGPCEQLRLYCTVEGAAKSAGASCETDLDCRPAADGVARLRCDHGSCVDDVRPAPPPSYGSRCGISDASLGSEVGEGAIQTSDPRCDVCQWARAPGGCVRQACTMRCTYDEDCHRLDLPVLGSRRRQLLRRRHRPRDTGGSRGRATALRALTR